MLNFVPSSDCLAYETFAAAVATMVSVLVWIDLIGLFGLSFLLL